MVAHTQGKEQIFHLDSKAGGLVSRGDIKYSREVRPYAFFMHKETLLQSYPHTRQ